ncbi:MAG: hypothetical protein AVDCRST_MAG69-2899, partial [uncultured Solirubrobacteraceae bacterium]
MRVLRAALAGIHARRGRSALAALGVAAAAVVVGAAVTLGYGLSTGFERAAAEADLPSVLARFEADRP